MKDSSRIYMVLDGDVYDQLLDNGKMMLSQRFRARAAALMEKESLRKELRRFYRTHAGYFSSPGKAHKAIELHASREIFVFLHSLGFWVMNQGNISQISRVIFYHYAVQQQWLPEPPEVTTKDGQPVAPARPPRVGKVALPPLIPDRRSDPKCPLYTIDTLFAADPVTKANMDALRCTLQLGQAAMMRHLIEESANGATREKIRKAFTARTRSDLAEPAKTARIRYRLSPKLAKVLDRLSLDIVGEANRSLTLRTMIEYYALEYGITKR